MLPTERGADQADLRTFAAGLAAGAFLAAAAFFAGGALAAVISFLAFAALRLVADGWWARASWAVRRLASSAEARSMTVALAAGASSNTGVLPAAFCSMICSTARRYSSLYKLGS